ncbi:3'-5' exoribonuclease 1 [Branchiostoma belcheri]|nr:3'-5' exoribonuclease 1 [Branchiostoma belcheri]
MLNEIVLVGGLIFVFTLLYLSFLLPSKMIGNDEDDKENSTKTGGRGGDRDPVLRELSLTNGQINRMNKEEVRQKLEELHLETRGVKEVLKKRLKSYYKKEKLSPNSAPERYDFLLVIDFEATCMEENPPDFQHEIIEFPILLVNTETLIVEDQFHSYCKPTINPKLTPFCTKLTGITQKMVDKAPEFPQVLEDVLDWMSSKGYGMGHSRFAVATDGPWDMCRFLYQQCLYCGIPYPRPFRKWINVKKHFANFYQTKGGTKLEEMLASLGLKFEGKPHSGRDDAVNIARIAGRLIQDGCELRVNECLNNGRVEPVVSQRAKLASSN